VCVDLGLVVATEMSDMPFVFMPNDAVIGLGLEALAIDRHFSFLSMCGDRFAHGEQNGGSVYSQFALYLGRGPEDGGEIVFGGYNPERLAVPDSLVWVPVVNPEMGFWQVSVLGVRVGNKTLALCQNSVGNEKNLCRGAVETGSARFGLSDELGTVLEPALQRADAGVQDAQAAESEQQQESGKRLEVLELLLTGGVVLTLPPEDYVSSPYCLKQTCKTLIERRGKSSENVFVLGESLLKRYYTVFDWGAKRIGFGMATGVIQNSEL